MQIDGAHGSMMFCWVMLCKIIGAIAGSGLPVDVKLFLGFAILEPIVAHIHCLGTTDFDFVVDDARRCFVVRDEWCAGLIKTKFLQGDTQGQSFWGIGKGSGGFSFSSRGDNILENFAGVDDGAVIRWKWIIWSGMFAGFVAEEKVAGDTGAPAAKGQIQGV